MLFRITLSFGVCPYDGFHIKTMQPPRQEFIDRFLREAVVVTPTRGMHNRPVRKLPVRRYFVSLDIGGQANALKVSWEPLFPTWEKVAYTRVYFNPSRTGYDAQQTYELLLTVLEDPLAALMADVDTKVDVVMPYWTAAAHVYYPYARNSDHAEWLSEAGTIYEGKRTRFTTYAKAGDHEPLHLGRQDDDGEPVDPTTRFEIRQRFNDPPTFRDFITGRLIEKNRLRALRVVEDLEKLGDRVLAEEAMKRGGLTRALREYREFANVSARDIRLMKAHINTIATRELFEHYKRLAEDWHGTFRG